ncbi:hypothetical protein K3495_g9876 [Podosphaera aphanis]|nr:hypothetical protein K3495_g9876 [Podosphaera aphanis]
MSSRGFVISSVDTTQQSWLSRSQKLSSKILRPQDSLPARPKTQSRHSTEDTTMTNSAATPFDKDEQQLKLFKQLYLTTESKIAKLFDVTQTTEESSENSNAHVEGRLINVEDDVFQQVKEAPKKSARVIDEDNYDDEDEEDEEHDAQSLSLNNKSTNTVLSPLKSNSPVSPNLFSTNQIEYNKCGQPKSSENVRMQLEQAKRATEEAAKRSFHTLFFTLENDRIAMLEQQRLEESEKQIDAEMGNTNANNNANGEHHGSLSNTNLGASSLTLKHLIARIDLKRDQVRASDAELRSLMNEVRKNRSKWASEENVHQEELYEAADKVLSELKAMTEYSAPFLTRVNKRDAPDYYNVIKQSMDLGTMTKKLKTLSYKSKAEFVADLDLIWSNCLKYNADAAHPLRRNANSMKKEAEKLVPLIPDLVIRPRAEVEAEERRKQNGGEDDVVDDSDDEPVKSSRGRKAGAKGSMARKTASRDQCTATTDHKPTLQLNGNLGNSIPDASDVGIECLQNGVSASPKGSITPLYGTSADAGQTDAMKIDEPIINGLPLNSNADIHEDEEYKIWKQVTKKDRALIAKERHLLFRGDKLNPDEPALLRSKAGMRKWIRQQAQLHTGKASQTGSDVQSKDGIQGASTLAEGMEGEEERVLPDYYDYLSAIPDISVKLQWHEDAEGQLVDRSEETMRMVPKGHFVAPKSILTSKFEDNMRQMQETRKLCSKIGVIKQMQLQAQTYNNQFSRYEPEPFVEADIEAHVVSDDGPIMATWVCKAAMQRSIARICYAAGFEELQPSALEVITDIAGDYFSQIAQTFCLYREVPKIPANERLASSGVRFQERFTDEEVVLHTLSENGAEIETLESYVKDDIERFGQKLGVMHERIKAHLSDLLRPALTDGGADGSGAFKDGSEQFVGGDFAEELGEDFFGFKALGLDAEFGLASLSVPLHLLHTRLYKNQPSQAVEGPTMDIIKPLPPLEPITIENVKEQIGLIRDFFLSKLKANSNRPLLEDDQLPAKQRHARPRLGPTGKITMPRKRPIKEVAGNSKKKKRLENGVAMDPSTGTKTGLNASPEKENPQTSSDKKAKPLLRDESPSPADKAEVNQDNQDQPENDDINSVGMSPQSIER